MDVKDIPIVDLRLGGSKDFGYSHEIVKIQLSS